MSLRTLQIQFVAGLLPLIPALLLTLSPNISWAQDEDIPPTAEPPPIFDDPGMYGGGDYVPPPPPPPPPPAFGYDENGQPYTDPNAYPGQPGTDPNLGALPADGSPDMDLEPESKSVNALPVEELPAEVSIQEKAPQALPPPAKAPPALSRNAALEEEWDPRVPKFHQMHPKWGIQLSVAPQVFGNEKVLPNQGSGLLRAVALQVEYQPEFAKRFGVLGIGGGFAIYPVTLSEEVTESALSIWSFGAHVKYQARFFREQPIVPILGYGLDYWNYSVKTGDSGYVASQGAILGAWILLNTFDRESAAQFYTEHGAKRSYLTAEMRLNSGSDDLITLAGASYFFGLRVEF